tara:strand:+ start:457 stop:657 length:201 start_codon:yes stop_codon:yes gene_type:complete
MDIIDIKNLSTNEMVELKENLEKEIAFREDVGEEIIQRTQLREAKQDNGIRNYPEGCFEYSITKEP